MPMEQRDCEARAKRSEVKVVLIRLIQLPSSEKGRYYTAFHVEQHYLIYQIASEEHLYRQEKRQGFEMLGR